MYNMRAGNDPGSMVLTEELLRAKYILLHNGTVSTHFIKLASMGPKVYLREQLIKEGYPINHKTADSGTSVDYDKEPKRIYLVYSLCKSNSSEDIFQEFKWQINELSAGRTTKKPFTISIGKLMDKAITK